MKQINISFSPQEVFAEIALQSAYAGVKNGDSSRFFDKVATAKSDEALLNRFLTEMAGVIADHLKAFVVDYSCSPASFSISLEVSGAYDDSLTLSVTSDLFAALSAGVTARWFALAYPEKASEFSAKTDALLSRVYSKLYSRKKPARP